LIYMQDCTRNVKRIYWIGLGLGLLIAGAVMGIVGFMGSHEDVGMEPVFVLCPVGVGVFRLGGVIFLFVRRGRVS